MNKSFLAVIAIGVTSMPVVLAGAPGPAHAEPTCTSTLTPSPDAACLAETSEGFTGQPNADDVRDIVNKPNLHLLSKYEGASGSLAFGFEKGKGDFFTFTGGSDQDDNDVKAGTWSTTLSDTTDVVVALKGATTVAIFALNGETSGGWTTPKGLSNVQALGEGGYDTPIPVPATLGLLGTGLGGLGVGRAVGRWRERAPR